MAFSFGRRGSGSSGGGGGDQTLANIPGTLGTTKGGTGLNADDLDALKTGLGIGAQVDPERLGLTEGASEAGKTVKLNSTGDGFVAETVTGGGGAPDVGNATGVLPLAHGGTGTSASSLTVLQSTLGIGTSSVDPARLGLTEGSGEAGKFVTLNSSGDGFAAKDEIEPSDLGVTEGSSEAGKHVVLDSAGTGFTTTTISGGGGSNVTLATITGGPLATGKGGTGINANDLADLRSKLGINHAGGTTEEDVLEYLNNADVQQDHTLYRFDSSTASLPSDAPSNAAGAMTRVGALQFMQDFTTGHEWVRSLTHPTENTTWSTPSNATLTNLANEAAFRGVADGGRGYSSTAAWLPEYPNGTKPTKIIFARKGNYLLAIDRFNFWWANRPTDSTWTSIDWHWQNQDGAIPDGLFYTGGESDERLIPVGEDAVLAGKTGIDGEVGVTVLVNHTLDTSASPPASTYTAYFINDDGAMTIQSSTNGRSYQHGAWGRTKVDAAGIDDDIVITDASGDPVVVASVPSIDDIEFGDYEFKTATQGLQRGEVAYVAATRQMYVIAKLSDPHLAGLFDTDYEVEIRKDSSNYIRGVFTQPLTLPGGLSGGNMRADDLDIRGTINADDTVSILGHKAFLGKTDTISPINLGLSHGSGQANDFIVYNNAGDEFAAQDGITPANLGLTTGADEAGKTIMLDSSGTGFTATTVTGGGSGTVAPSNMGLSGSSNADRFIRVNNARTGFYTSRIELDDIYNPIRKASAQYALQSATPAAAGEIRIIENSNNTQAVIWRRDDDLGVLDALSASHNDTVVIYKDDSTYVYGTVTAVTGSQPTTFTIAGTGYERRGSFGTSGNVDIASHVEKPDSIYSVDRKGELSLRAPVNIEPRNLGLTEGSAEAGKTLMLDSSGTGFTATTVSSSSFPSTLALPTVTKYSYTFKSTAAAEGDVSLSSTTLTIWGSQADQLLTAAVVNGSINNFRPIIIYKDATNYSMVVVASETNASGAFICTIDASQTVTVGTLANNDSVEIWLAPETMAYTLSLNDLGDAYILAPPNPFMVYGRQSGNVSVSNDGTNNWRALNFNTKPWKFDSDFYNRNRSHADISAAGVCFLGAGAVGAVNLQAQVQYRYADTAHGTYNSWTELGNMTQNGSRTFNSKVAAGSSTNAISHRDYWGQWSLSFPLVNLPAAAIDKWVQFRTAFRRENTNFPRLELMYDHNIAVRFYANGSALGF